MKKPVFLILVAFLFVSCGGRLPAPETAQKMTVRYFKKYGKKQKETDFGRYKVTKVEIDKMREVQKGIAEVEAFVVLGDGQAVHKVNMLAKKKAFRWKVQSWEDLGGSH
ncbi:MAG: hypothetical protein Q7S00_04230 [bacterium]|nr:hypothetical protein [bacterium]